MTSEVPARPDPSPIRTETGRVTHKTPIVTDVDGERLEKFRRAMKKVEETFITKNAPDHYDHAYEELGLLGVGVEATGIVARLKKAVIRSGDGGESFDRDKLVDLLTDLAVYGLIGLMMVLDKNWTGK